jgi:hypothetical protein
MDDEPTTENEQPTDEDIKQFAAIKKQAEHDLYYAIGSAITSWSRMEGLLVFVTSMLLGTSPEKAGLVSYSMNIHPWLTVIDELFAFDPDYVALRPHWVEIDKRLRKLNDVRTRLAHHSVVEGKGIEVLVTGGDEKEVLPLLVANEYDVRSKTKKQAPLQIFELGQFITDLNPVIDQISNLLDLMTPIYLAPNEKLLAKIKAIRQRVSQLVEAKKSEAQSDGAVAIVPTALLT